MTIDSAGLLVNLWRRTQVSGLILVVYTLPQIPARLFSTCYKVTNIYLSKTWTHLTLNKDSVPFSMHQVSLLPLQGSSHTSFSPFPTNPPFLYVTICMVKGCWATSLKYERIVLSTTIGISYARIYISLGFINPHILCEFELISMN